MFKKIKLISFLIFFLLFCVPFFFKSYSFAENCAKGSPDRCSGNTPQQCLLTDPFSNTYSWVNKTPCGSGQVCAGAGACYLPCSSLGACQLDTNVCNNGFGGHYYLGDAYCNAVTSGHPTCCNSTCNINSCSPRWCDRNCGIHNPACGANGCMQGSLIQSNSTQCNGIPYGGTPLSCLGTCGATHYTCTDGVSGNNADAGTQYTWTCSGANGGSTASCSEIKPNSNVTGQVYIDYNGNGVLDGEDVGKAGVTVSDGVDASVITDANGNYTIANVIPGTYTMTFSNYGSNYTITYPNPYPSSIVTSPGINVTQNFGIQPPAPTCTGGVVTATPAQIYVGGNPLPATSSLNIAGCVTGGGAPGAVTYTWTPATQGTITQVNAATTTYTPPAAGATYTQVDIAPSVSVCNPGGVGATCKPYGGSLILIPTFSAIGQVFVDEDKNGQINGTDHAYTDSSLSVTICAGNQPGGCASPYETLTTNPANGTFTTVGTKPLLSGSYTAIMALPSGYHATSPKPPVAVFTVGNASTGNTCAPNANCDVNGNILNLNFGISNTFPWMQAIGGDITGSYISKSAGGGFTDNIPSTADPLCSSGGAYALAPGVGGTHGLVNTGSGGADFGQGQAAAANSWLVGGIGAGNYPYVYNMPLSNQARTAYTNLSFLVKQSNVVTKPLSGVSGCGDLSNCQLPVDLPTGVYTTDQNLTLNGANGTYTFPAGKYVILVNGKLTINTKIFVPNGSFVLFSASDDINVASSVGDVANSTASNLEGYYSTDKSFNVQSKDASGGGANCAANDEDLRLNVAGSIVVNATTNNNGGFYYQRDLCADDKKCPVFTITERPDFILNAPTFLMFPRRVWQEVAP
ncbi:MAG TPA: SdrD B-like domain-containing protein [Patescibacteria group bacterium]|jgi:hypothetical protein|nr:SdrD B-like domain-containing protein [Patescibacteria group bacterium]